MFTSTAQAAAIIPPPRSPYLFVDGTSKEVLLPGKSAAAAEAALVVGGFRSGVRAVIDACVRTNEAVQSYPDDNPDLIDAFLAVLVDANIMSRSEARLGKASPKLSKFKTIGQKAEMLRDERVCVPKT